MAQTRQFITPTGSCSRADGEDTPVEWSSATSAWRRSTDGVRQLIPSAHPRGHVETSMAPTANYDCSIMFMSAMRIPMVPDGASWELHKFS